jgi:Tol biopolymer transport system component
MNQRPRQSALYRGMPLLGAALVALAACGETDSPLAPAEAPAPELGVTSPGPLPGRIAFSSTRDGVQSDIYLINPDGSGLTRLTSFPGNEQRPAWSWDNTKIAFMRGRADASATVHNDIFVIDANGANGHWVSPTPSTEDLSAPDWSPDGSRILVSGAEGRIMSMDVATGALTQVKSGQGDVFGLFSSFDATGQKIVFSSGGVFTMNADGTGVPSGIAPPHLGTVESPSFSPDGTKILFTEATSPDRSRNMYVLAGDTFTLLSSHGVGFKASWAPDGQQIVFSSNRGQLYRMTADGKNRVRLTAGPLDFTPAYTH